jgi:anaerobic ribonucleoside-triphosphate reductase activating protein
MQEIPEEVSLAFIISGCKNNCKDCHSHYLKEDIGKELSLDILKNIIDSNKDPITCILFLGHDDDFSEVTSAIKFIKEKYPHLKTAIYSGKNDIPKETWTYLDYGKIGPYNKFLGGIRSIITNQILYVNNGKSLKNITNMFWNI